MDDATWRTVERLVAWLDRANTGDAGQERLLRVLKLSEEVGEVAQAVIGVTGHNPRKGTTHTWEDVHAELCDVIVTAMVALASLTPDAAEVFAGHLRRVAERSLGPEPGATAERGARSPGTGEEPPGGDVPGDRPPGVGPAGGTTTAGGATGGAPDVPHPAHPAADVPRPAPARPAPAPAAEPQGASGPGTVGG